MRAGRWMMLTVGLALIGTACGADDARTVELPPPPAAESQSPASTTATPPIDVDPVEVGRSFLEANIARDAEVMAALFAPDATIKKGVITEREHFAGLVEWEKAIDLVWTLKKCWDAPASTGADVTCTFGVEVAWEHVLPEQSRGGSYNFVIVDGVITEMVTHFGSLGGWGTFADFVESSSSEDYNVMYDTEGPRFTPEAIVLWEEYTDRFVEERNNPTAFTVDEALAVSSEYIEAHNAGDAAAVLALLIPDVALSEKYSDLSDFGNDDPFEAIDRAFFEQHLAWATAQGTTFTLPECAVTEQGAGGEVNVVCEFGWHNAVKKAVDAPPVPTVLTMLVTPDGISQLAFEYVPAFGLHSFDSWLLANHRDDSEGVGYGDWDSVAEAEQGGTLRAQYVAEWAAFLEANDCNYKIICRPSDQ